MTHRDRNVRLFVGNLPYDTTEDDLRSMLHGCGTLRYLAIRKDYHTNKSRGYGNIEYRTEAECVEAIKRLGSMEIKGRPVKVDFCDDYYRDKYADVLMATLYQKESLQQQEMEPMPPQQGMGPMQFGMPVAQSSLPPMGHPDMPTFGQTSMGPMEQSSFGLVPTKMPMAQSNLMPIPPQGNIPMVQPNLPMVQPDIQLFPQPNMGMIQPSVPLIPPNLTQPSLVQQGLIPPSLIQSGLTQPSLVPSMSMPADISQLDPLGSVNPMSVPMDSALNQPINTHTSQHHQNQPMSQPMGPPVNQPLNPTFNPQISQHINPPLNNMNMPLNQTLNQQVSTPSSQQVHVPSNQQFITQEKQLSKKVDGTNKPQKTAVDRNGLVKESADYVKNDSKRYRSEEELLLENGKVVSKDLFHLIKKMSMMDVYNLVKKIDALMEKSPNTARSILNSNTSMRSALIHAKLLLGYKNFNFKNFSNVKASNVFEYFFIR